MSSQLGVPVAAAAEAAAAAKKDVANEISVALRAAVAKGLRDYWELLRTYQSFSAVAASVGKGAVARHAGRERQQGQGTRSGDLADVSASRRDFGRRSAGRPERLHGAVLLEFAPER